VRSTGHDIRNRDVDTYGMAGSQVHGRSASYGKSYAQSFFTGSNSKRGGPASAVELTTTEVNEFWCGDRVLV
jgi:hypothetical protein